MDKIVLIDKIPFSQQIHKWYSEENFDMFQDSFDWDTYISAFKDLMPKHSNGYLKNLTCDEFFTFINDVMDVSDGVARERKLKSSITIAQIENDIVKIKKCLMFWSFVENLEIEKFGAFDEWLFDKDRLRVNNKFHFMCYYIIKNIEHNVDKLKQIMNKLRINKLEDLKIDSSESSKNKEDVLKRIREAYRGDLEDFVLSTINKIQFDTVNKNHQKIAQMIRYQFMDIPNFDEELPYFEAWRFIKPTYFEKYEDSFDVFFEQFPFESVNYYINDFLNDDFGIISIPFYYCFYSSHDEKIYTSIISCIKVNDLDRRKKDLYGQYMENY